MRYGTFGRRWASRAGTIAVVAAVLLGGSACSSEQKSPPSAAATAPVVSAYQHLNTALQAKNGDAAAQLFTASTLSYYDKLRDLALDANRTTLERQPIREQLNTLGLRANVSPTLLRTGTPEQVVSAAVTTGVISLAFQPENSLQKLAVNGNQATAVLNFGIDQPQATTLRFAKESGVWKFDLTSLAKFTDTQYETARKFASVSAVKLVRSVAKSNYGAQRAAELWTPIGRG